MMRLRSKEGFTLVEIMLVVIIIGVLVAMVMPKLAGRGQQAREAAAKADIEANIGAAIDLYDVDNNKYPDSLDELIVNKASVPRWRGPYLKKKAVDPWGKEYVYVVPGAHGEYDLSSYGKDGQEGGGDDITNWE